MLHLVAHFVTGCLLGGPGPALAGAVCRLWSSIRWVKCQSTLAVFLLSGAEPILMSFIALYELFSVNCSAQSRDAVQVRVLCSLLGKGFLLARASRAEGLPSGARSWGHAQME